MNMWKDFKQTFRTPSAVELAAKELDEAERALLETLSAAEYARRMAEYHTDRIHRLTIYLRDARKNKHEV